MFTLGPEHLSLAPTTIMVLIALFAIIHDDLTCATVGVFIASGSLPVWPSVFACFVGTYLGDLGWFLAGRYIGQATVNRMITAEQTAKAKTFFQRYGALAIIASRFLPGLRTPVQIVAGLLFPNLLGACLYFLIAAVFYTPLLVGACALLGGALYVESFYQNYGPLVLICAAVALWLLLRLARFAVSYVERAVR